MKSSKVFSMLFAGLLFVAVCNAQSVKSEINVDLFKAIKVSEAINLYLTQGDEQSITVEADERNIEHVVVETRGKMLHVYFGGSRRIVITEPVNVYVTAVQLELIEVTSGASLHCKQQLKPKTLKVKCSSAGNAHIDVECFGLVLETSSGSDMEVKGSAVNLSANASSGSSIDTRKLEAINAILEASSGADITASVLNAIEAKASSASNILYYGAPEQRIIKQSSGGEVRNMR
ncbi:MAG: DUF2807 domain-containing protein [Cytophagaceae bacterium]|jgi:hypothetical protein|nr:DUF2807 domain-containing protein [Cytophagaceae bacterium]